QATTRLGREPVELLEAERAAVEDPRAIEAYRGRRSCHPLLPFVDWGACAPALGRLGAVIIAGCRDAVAARQLGFVPSQTIGTALEIPHGLQLGIASDAEVPAVSLGRELALALDAEVRLLDLLVLAQGLGFVGERD